MIMINRKNIPGIISKRRARILRQFFNARLKTSVSGELPVMINYQNIDDIHPCECPDKGFPDIIVR